MFLAKTIDVLLENIRGDTEIIAVLDGEWSDPPIQDHERVTLIYYSEFIGQRAATNKAAELSTAKYVMKLDAHCSVGEGFDVIMMEDMQPDWTMVPKMYNLYGFDWVCKQCSHRRYQSPSDPCEKCGGEVERDVLWRAKKSPETTAMRFDREFHFQYWGQYKKHQSGDLVDTMSILGACWMLERERYHELNILDEKHGSWGQMGTEVACKTWLSGGRLVCTKKTWFAHLFRTQGRDFGFPYPNPGVSKAREYSKKLWINNAWEGAIHPLSWMIAKFDPPDWEDYNVDVSKGIVYYTDNRLDPLIQSACQKQIAIAAGDRKIVSASLEPIEFGENIYLALERGYLTMFKQILAGLEALDTEVAFFCEHDVLYHPSHFDFVPLEKDRFYYNTNVWKVRLDDGHAMRTAKCQQTSGLCAYRELLLEHYRKRVDIVEEIGFSRKMGFEPGTHGRGERVDDYKSENWESEYPNIDIRHDKNLTPSRWSPDQFRNKRYTKGWQENDELPGWGMVKDEFRSLLLEMSDA
jgi:hypothetical protein